MLLPSSDVYTVKAGSALARFNRGRQGILEYALKSQYVGCSLVRPNYAVLHKMLLGGLRLS